VPPIRHFNALKNEHNHYVADQKTQRDDFKKLLKQWMDNEGETP
jgi:hypothetical protein